MKALRVTLWLTHYQHCRRCLLVICFMLTGASAVGATTYYVSPTGNDVNNGQSLVGAWATVQKCANTMRPGDTCRLQSGTYTEDNVQFKNSGSSANWITYTCDGACNIKGTSKRLLNYGFYILGASYIMFENLSLSTYFDGVRAESFGGNDVSNLTFRNFTVTDTSYDGFSMGANEDHITLDSVDVSYFGDHGIGFYALDPGQLNSNITIINSRVYNSTGESGQYHNAIDIHTQARDILLQNNTIYNIGGLQWGFYIHNFGIENIRILDNEIHDVGNGILIDGVINGTFSGNRITNYARYGIVFQPDLNAQSLNRNISVSNTVIDTGNTPGYGAVYFHFYGVTGIYSSDVTFDNMTILNSQGGLDYQFESNGDNYYRNIIIRNQNNNLFHIHKTSNPILSDSFVEYTDGRVFSVDGVGEYTSYSISSPGTNTIKVVGWKAVGNVSGTVRDAGTGFGIDSATVTDGTRTATTDAVGGFSLLNIPAGSGTITASKPGYRTASEAVTVTENSTVTVDFELIVEQDEESGVDGGDGGDGREAGAEDLGSDANDGSGGGDANRPPAVGGGCGCGTDGGAASAGAVLGLWLAVWGRISGGRRKGTT